MSINLDKLKCSYKNLGEELYNQNAIIDEEIIEKYGIEEVMCAYEKVLEEIKFSDTEGKRFPKMEPEEMVEKFFPGVQGNEYISRPVSFDRRTELKAELVDMVYSNQEGFVILSKGGPNIIAVEKSCKLHREYLYRCLHDETSLRFSPMSFVDEDRQEENKCTAFMIKIPLDGNRSAEATIRLLRKMYGDGPMNIPIPSHYIVEEPCLTMVYPLDGTICFNKKMEYRFFMYVAQRSIAKRLYAFDAYCEDLNYIQPIGDVPLYDVKFDHEEKEVKKTFIGWKRIDVIRESGKYCDYVKLQDMVLPIKPIFWTSHGAAILAGKLGFNIINGQRALPTWADLAKSRIEDLQKIRRYVVKMGLASEEKLQTLYFYYLLNSLILYKRQDRAVNAADEYIYSFKTKIDAEKLLSAKKYLLSRFEYEADNCKAIGIRDLSNGQDASKMLLYQGNESFYNAVGACYPSLKLNCMEHFDRKDYDWMRYEVTNGHKKQKDIELIYTAINICDLKYGITWGNKEVIKYLANKKRPITTKMVNYHRNQMRERKCYLPDLYTLESKGWEELPMKKLTKAVIKEMEALMPWSYKNKKDSNKYRKANKNWYNNERMFMDLDMLKSVVISKMIVNVLNNRPATFDVLKNASAIFSWDEIIVPTSVADAAHKKLNNVVVIVTKNLYKKISQTVRKYNLSFKSKPTPKCKNIIPSMTG